MTKDKPNTGKLKAEIQEIIRCTCYKCKPKVVKRLLMVVNRALASSEQRIQGAYEQGVEDANVDSRNEYEPKINELEQELKLRFVELQMEREIMIDKNKKLAEKDKEIEKLKASNSIYKALNERLKKENRIPFEKRSSNPKNDTVFHNHIKAHFEKEHPDWKVICKICGRNYEDIVGEEPVTVNQTLSELREEIEKIHCYCDNQDMIRKEAVLKAIDSRRTA